MCRWQSRFGLTCSPAELMGGTLTIFIAYDRSSVAGRGGYTDTLLGPERTRECFFPGKTYDPLGSPRNRLALPAGPGI